MLEVPDPPAGETGFLIVTWTHDVGWRWYVFESLGAAKAVMRHVRPVHQHLDEPVKEEIVRAPGFVGAGSCSCYCDPPWFYRRSRKLTAAELIAENLTDAVRSADAFFEPEISSSPA